MHFINSVGAMAPLAPPVPTPMSVGMTRGVVECIIMTSWVSVCTEKNLLCVVMVM